MFNLFEKFASLLPRDNLRQGTAVTNYADGTALLNTPGGGSVRVYRNSVNVVSGQTYFFKQSGVVGLAPSLTAVELTV